MVLCSCIFLLWVRLIIPFLWPCWTETASVREAYWKPITMYPCVVKTAGVLILLLKPGKKVGLGPARWVSCSSGWRAGACQALEKLLWFPPCFQVGAGQVPFEGLPATPSPTHVLGLITFESNRYWPYVSLEAKYYRIGFSVFLCLEPPGLPHHCDQLSAPLKAVEGTRLGLADH